MGTPRLSTHPAMWQRATGADAHENAGWVTVQSGAGSAPTALGDEADQPTNQSMVANGQRRRERIIMR